MDIRPSGTVTFLFTDIEGSTKLAREHPESWENLRSRHHEILHEAIESNNGFVFQIIGDAFCAAFYTAGDALKAAIKAQQNLQNASFQDSILRARMGIHTGEAQAHGNDYHGYLTLSLVQRMMSAGHGGQVLLSGATEMLLRGQIPPSISLRDMGEHRFKDVPHRIGVFQVVAPELQNNFPALRTLDVIPNNIPIQLTSFIGREKEVADVQNLLEKTHLLTLIGPGGTGKTRLSLEVGTNLLHADPDGVWFIELAPVSDAAAVPAAALAALDLPAEVHRPGIDMLSDFLREKEALLILDNCEHLVDACARFVDHLLHAASKLRILASSREALGIAGEVSYRVPSLGLPNIKQLPSLESLSQYEAVRLFIDRARAAQPSFHVTNENAPAVAQICYRLDGIPLALELAAAKVRALSVDQIARRLDDRFRLLTGGNRTALERHQTLRATLDWSYNLLPAAEQVLFRRLATFVNGWTLEAAESVCSDESIRYEHVFELLEQLVNKSLVLAQEWKDETRYSILETMRQYAGEKLVESGESESLRDRHLNYYLELAETAAPYLIRNEQIIWLDRLEADHDNFRQALEWALWKQHAEPALRLSAALGQFWEMHGYWLEGAQWLERALQKAFEITNQVEKRARIRALYQDASLAQLLDNLERARDSAYASLALAEMGTDRRDVAIARLYLGMAVYRTDDSQTASALFEQSLADFQDLKDLYWEAFCEYQMSFIRYFEGKENTPERIKHFMEYARKAGERRLLLNVLIDQAYWEWQNLHLEKAEEYLEEAQKLQEQLGLKDLNIDRLYGSIEHCLGQYAVAKEYYLKTIQQSELIGERNVRSFVWHLLSILEIDIGNLLQAREYANKSLNTAKEFGGGSATGVSYALLGHLSFLEGNLQEFKSNFMEALRIVQEMDSSELETNTLMHLGSTIPNQRPDFAVNLVASIHAYFTDFLREPINPFFLIYGDRAVAQARLRLDESEFQAAWEAGEKMSLDEAVGLAIQIVQET